MIGLILHQAQIVSGNTRHIGAFLKEPETLDVTVLPPFTRIAANEEDRQGVRHAMERYFAWNGKRLPDIIIVIAGFSLTHMGLPGDGARERMESIFAGWDVPAIQFRLIAVGSPTNVRLPKLLQWLNPCSIHCIAKYGNGLAQDSHLIPFMCKHTCIF